MEKCTEVQCRVQYLSTNADTLVTHNPTKAQSIPSPQQVPCAPSSPGMVPFTPTRISVLPKSKDILLHKHGQTVKTWTSTMLTIVWSNLQTWLISPIFSLSFYWKRTHFCTGCSQESHTTHTWTVTLVYSKVGTAAFTGLSHPHRPDCVGCPQLGFACQFLKIYNPRSECAPPRVSCQEARCQLVPTLG